MANNSKMKKSLNRTKRKIIPMCYQKLNLSRSNTSLSQLISIGVYKKRINDLVRNNRLLAIALQEARCDSAYQSNLLKECAKSSNQMKIAKFKLNDMAKTITKLVSDLNEVVQCLEDDCSVDSYNLLQNKGPHDRMRIKEPTIEPVEEEGSMLSSENDECGTVLKKNSLEETHKGGPMPEIVPDVPECEANLAEIPDQPPILYIDDSEEQSSSRKSSKKSKSRSSSRRRLANDQLSLTPELDIDFDFMSQRENSSRRQTQVFTPARKLSKSQKALSLDRTFIEHDTPRKSLRRESKPQRKLSPVLMECDISSEYDDKTEILNINTKIRGSKDENLSDLQLSSVNTDEEPVNTNSPPDISLMVSPGKITVNNAANNYCTLANHTIISSEDMELTDVIRPVAELEIGSIPTNIVKAPFSNLSDLHTVGNKDERLNLVLKEACDDSKLLAYSEETEVIPPNEYLNIAEKEGPDPITEAMSPEEGDRLSDSAVSIDENPSKSPVESNKLSENAVSIDKSPSKSPVQRRSSRKRKIVALEFSPTDSDSDFTPVKPDKIKKKKVQRDTVIYKPQKRASDVLVSSENTKKCSLASEEGRKLSPSALSVYDLDVSNSKMPEKKSRSRNKAKSSLNKPIAKPLSQKYSITKLKGAEFKLTKNENIDVKNKENQLTDISKSQDTIPMNLQSNACKGNPSIFSSDQRENVTENKKSLSASRDEVSSPKVADSMSKENFKSPGARRVSFASTDVVCNFTRMSIPKRIIQNKKVHRISKSNFNTVDFNFENLEMNETNQCPSSINVVFNSVTENNNLIEKPHNHVSGKNHEDLGLKLHKEAKVVKLTKSNLHPLDEGFLTSDPLLPEEDSLNAQNVVLPSEMLVIPSTSTDENAHSVPHKEDSELCEDDQLLVSNKKSDSIDIKHQKFSKISNKKSEKCIVMKVGDLQNLKSLDSDSPVIQKKGQSHKSVDKNENTNSKFVKKNSNSRKSISAHNSGIINKDVNSKTPPKHLTLQKKAQMHSSNILAENLDSKSTKKTLNFQKNTQPCSLSDVIENEKNTIAQTEIQPTCTSNVVKESESESLKEITDVLIKEKSLTLDNIGEDLKLKSLKATASIEKKELAHCSDNQVEDVSEPPKRCKQSRKKAHQPISGKIHKDINTLPKSCNSSFQSTNNSPHKMMTQDDFKENILGSHHILVSAQTDPHIKTKKSLQKSLPPADNLLIKIPEDQNMKDLAQTVHKKGVPVLESCQSSASKKSSCLRLSVESSPVLKDVMNLEENTNNRSSSRRAKKAVNYKDPPLNVKMRRN